MVAEKKKRVDWQGLLDFVKAHLARHNKITAIELSEETGCNLNIAYQVLAALQHCEPENYTYCKGVLRKRVKQL
ncbi:MAG: hypothetical protein NZ931_06460 [Aigarchaeota archaeon]|nr:hypothetical protein [Aigarchaeota archaeon]